MWQKYDLCYFSVMMDEDSGSNVQAAPTTQSDKKTN